MIHDQFFVKNIDELLPYKNNSRTHSDEQISQVVNSINEFGFTNPILIDDKNGVIAGHCRLDAAKKIGLESVPCIRLSGLSEAQKKAYVIADNQLALNASWDIDLLKIEIQELDDFDFDLDLIGFDSEFLDDLLFIEPEFNENEIDEIKELEGKTASNRGDIWLLGDHRVMCGDSTSSDDVENVLNGKTIDMIFSDPPYGVSYADKNKFLNAVDKGNINQTPIENDHLTLEQTGKLWADVFSLWSQYLSDYSSYYIASPQGGDLFLMMMMMNEHGFPLRHCIIWNKNNHVLGRSDYNYKHEPILYGWSKKHKFYGNGQHKSSVWDIPKPLKNDLHPTMKPVALVENCIKNSTQHKMLVADMFLGSGTTIIAAEQTGRYCYGMELSEKYVDVIVNRWQEITGKKAMLETTGELFDDMRKKNGN